MVNSIVVKKKKEEEERKKYWRLNKLILNGYKKPRETEGTRLTKELVHANLSHWVWPVKSEQGWLEAENPLDVAVHSSQSRGYYIPQKFLFSK